MIILGYYSKINPLFLAFFLIFNHSACEDSDAQRLPLSYVNPSDSPVIYQKHIQPLPPLQFFSCDQKSLLQLLGIFLRSQRYQTPECTWHQIGAGNTAKKPVCGLPKFQGIKNIQEILLQGILLIYERKPNQHITVNHSACIVDIAALSIRIAGANRKSGVIISRGILLLPNINQPVF